MGILSRTHARQDQCLPRRPHGLRQERRRSRSWRARSGLPFHDSDAEIERRTGVDIPFIFEKEGEAGFRQREREAIEALTATPHIVLATGGGAVLLQENRRNLRERGCVVYLQTSVTQQAERVRHGRNRPLLSDGRRRRRASRTSWNCARRCTRRSRTSSCRPTAAGCPSVAEHILRELASVPGAR